MKIEKTNLDGVLLVQLDIFPDDRGSFREAWQTEKLHVLGFPSFKPIQNNIVESKRGVIRGIHGEPWGKYVHVIHGSVYAVIVDLRVNSTDFGKHQGFELDQTKALYIPSGYGNSYQTLSDVSYYSYLVTKHWKPDIKYESVRYDDPDLCIKWPIKEIIVSDKDASNPSLREAFPRKFESLSS